MNDNDAFLEVVRADMKVFADRQKQHSGQADRFEIVRNYAGRFPKIDFHEIETTVLREAQRAGVHL